MLNYWVTPGPMEPDEGVSSSASLAGASDVAAASVLSRVMP